MDRRTECKRKEWNEGCVPKKTDGKCGSDWPTKFCVVSEGYKWQSSRISFWVQNSRALISEQSWYVLHRCQCAPLTSETDGTHLTVSDMREVCLFLWFMIMMCAHWNSQWAFVWLRMLTSVTSDAAGAVRNISMGWTCVKIEWFDYWTPLWFLTILTRVQLGDACAESKIRGSSCILIGSPAMFCPHLKCTDTVWDRIVQIFLTSSNVLCAQINDLLSQDFEHFFGSWSMVSGKRKWLVKNTDNGDIPERWKILAPNQSINFHLWILCDHHFSSFGSTWHSGESFGGMWNMSNHWMPIVICVLEELSSMHIKCFGNVRKSDNN